jgi:hypothetical protein
MSDDQSELFRVTEAKRPTSMSRDAPVHRAGDSYAPAPPSGPAADSYSRFDSRPEKFVAFILSEDGVTFMANAERAARDALRQGHNRFSVLGYIHEYRAVHKQRVNNTFAPWVADELVVRHPKLLDIIERRVRNMPGPRS